MTEISDEADPALTCFEHFVGELIDPGSVFHIKLVCGKVSAFQFRRSIPVEHLKTDDP